MFVSYLGALLVKGPLIIFSTIIYGSVSVCISFFDREGRVTDRIARSWGRLLVRIARVKIRVSGLENVDVSQSHIFVGNHTSLMDTPVLLSTVPNRFLFLVNAKYVRMPFMGTHLRRTGHFSVDESDVRGSLKILTEAARVMKRRGLSVLLFPEGTRARGEMGQFKEGAAYLAIKAGVPLIPFAIHGTREVLPVGSIHVKGGLVDIVFGEPISSGGYTLRDRAKLNKVLFEKVAGMVEELRQSRPN